MKEVWKDINGYNGHYQISNHGNVRSFKNSRHGISEKSKLLSTPKLKNGYNCVGLSNNGKVTTKYIHHLVADAFIPNPKCKPQINHIDGNKENNNVSNLEWVTVSENCIHANKNGLINKAKGEGHPHSKIRAVDVLQIRSIYSQKFFTQKEISEAYGIGITQVSYIVNNKKWKHL